MPRAISSGKRCRGPFSVIREESHLLSCWSQGAMLPREFCLKLLPGTLLSLPLPFVALSVIPGLQRRW